MGRTDKRIENEKKGGKLKSMFTRRKEETNKETKKQRNKETKREIRKQRNRNKSLKNEANEQREK